MKRAIFMASQNNNNPDRDNTEECAQLRHILLDVDFFDKPTIRALGYKFGQQSLLIYIRWLMLMSRATNALVTRDCLYSVAKEVLGSDAAAKNATPESILNYCLQTKMIQQIGDRFSNQRVIKDQKSCWVKKHRSAERQRRFKNKIIEEREYKGNALLTRFSDTDTVYDHDHRSSDHDLPPEVAGEVGGMGGGDPPLAAVPTELQEFWAEANNALTPPSDPTIQNSNQFISCGKRPMRKYPNIWLSPVELAQAMRVYTESGVPPNQFYRAFLRINGRLTQMRNGTRELDRVGAFNWLIGWCLKEVLEELKALKDLKRSDNYLGKSQEARA